jgi:cholesterol oxidase
MNPYQPISRPITAIGSSYSVVVVGSGYGGAIAASRLARAGRSVCVLERGREIPPGQYPNDLGTARADMQVDGRRGTLGPRDGLYDLRLNDDMLALVGCGLGGTSLINANTALEMDPRLFADPAWPALFREEPGFLEPYAQRARAMLDVQPYPEQAPALNKLRALQRSALALRRPFRRPPIAVNFKDQVNPFGVAQPACNNCGDCTSGCNVGAKNTTLMNYLPDACRHGAQVFTGARVTHLEREGTQWRVHFEAIPLRGPKGNPPSQPSPPGSVVADIVMLGAGVLGSTEILLRSKARGLALSDRVGRSFSGNGDVLAFGYDSFWRMDGSGPDGKEKPMPVHGIGAGSSKLQPQQMPGPCIAGVIDLRQAQDPHEGLVIEEGVIPGALATLMPPMLFAASAMAGGETRYGASQAAARLQDAQALGDAVQDDPDSLTGRAYVGPVARTQTYLVMGVDDAGGELRLVDDRLRIHWPGAGMSSTIASANRWLAAANEAVQGVFLANPLWREDQGHKLITVHPLGGCGMGDDAERGVTNVDGQVYAGATGTAVHEGLYVCDGSLLPAAAGVNPLLTISALAERCCQRLCDARGWSFDLTLPAAKPLPRRVEAAAAADRVVALPEQLEHGAEALLKSALHHLEDGAIDVAHRLLSELIAKHPEWLSPGFQFTERMRGFVSLDSECPSSEDAPPVLVSRHELSTAWGHAAGRALDFDLTIRTEDLYRMVNDPSHLAAITGQVTCAALSAQPMTVQSGTFRLLPPAPETVETWTMVYEMELARPGAASLRFTGHKWLHQQPGSSPWTNLTTLFVDMAEAGPTPRPVARGILRLDLDDFIWQVTTLSVSPSRNVAGRIEKLVPAAESAIADAYLAKLAGFFGGTVFTAYGGLLSDLAAATATPPATPKRALRLPGAEVFPLEVGGGVVLRLTRYKAGRKGPLILAAGIAMRASSWALDTVPENLAETLCAQGYDVWLFDYRGSPDAVGSQQRFCIDDIARIDWPAAVDFVRRATGADTVQVLGHCVGSMSLLMALLSGLQGVRSAISSQVTLHPLTYWLNEAKADIGLARLMEHAGNLGGLFRPLSGSTQADRELDVLAWSVPVPPGQTCKSPVCKRINAFFGPVVLHEQLDEATHAAMGSMFGPISLSVFDQLTLIMQQGQVVDALGGNTYLTADNARRMQLPISFMSGGLNTLFKPESSLRTEAWLARCNGPGWYRRRVMERYGHLDNFVGRDAARDVFPWVLGELERGDAAR